MLAVVSDRTGYPLDMIEPDLDLEADLSVDSIKRTEIAGALGARLLGTSAGLGELDDAELEELTRARTVAAIAGWLSVRLERTGEAAEAGPELRVDRDPEPLAAAAAAQAPAGRAPRRYIPAPVLLARDPGPHEAAAGVLDGRRFLLVGAGGPVAGALTTRLTALGAHTVQHGSGTEIPAGPFDGVLDLEALPGEGDTGPVLPGAFPLFQRLLGKGLRWLLAARTESGDLAGAGLDGFVRTVAREYPDTLARSVHLPDALSADEVAHALVGEVLAVDRAPVVVHGPDGLRYGIEPRETVLADLGRGAGPAGDGACEAAAAGLGPESVLLVTGGARGITARFAIAAAIAARCRIELLGRTEWADAAEDPDLEGAPDRAALRSALVRRGGGSPAEIEREVSRILACREIRSTLGQIRAAGGRADYRCVDMRDERAVRDAVRAVHAAHGRIDGVVHGAGVIEDKLIAAKDVASFERVYATKASGAEALLAALRELSCVPGFTVFFGSIAAVFGNRGQADYATANAALATIGRRWRAESGGRCLTVHWGPWAPAALHGGMVGPELGREYARRGIDLIDPEEGVLALLRELAWGDPQTDEVVYTASSW